MALAYVPGTKPAAVGAEGDALVLPAEPGAGGDVTDAIRGVATKLDRIPFESIGADLQATLRSVDRTARRMPDISDQLEQAARHVNEALGQTGYGQDSEFQRNVQLLLHQIQSTARSVRLLADFLDRHPESLLRGRSERP